MSGLRLRWVIGPSGAHLGYSGQQMVLVVACGSGPDGAPSWAYERPELSGSAHEAGFEGYRSAALARQAAERAWALWLARAGLGPAG